MNRYLETTGDYAGAVLLPLFAVHRALVRLKVSLIRSRQAGLDAAARTRLEHEITRHLEVADCLSAPPTPRLFITCGLAGSGKTTVSSALVEALGAIRLRSDVERKRLAGLAAAERSGSPVGGGIYAAEGSARTYDRLAALARELLRSGRSVIVDAAFLERAQRARFRTIARAGGFRFRMLVCTAPVEVLRARIAARAAAGRDASEADFAVLEHQLAHVESPGEDERADELVIETDRPPESVRASIQAIVAGD